MKLETVVTEDALLFRLAGDVDHHRAPELRREMDEKVAQGGVRRVILDFSQTDFMDSSGLGLILGRKEKCDERGICLILQNPTDQILRLIRLSGLEKVIPIEYA